VLLLERIVTAYDIISFMLDTIRKIETPEGVELELRVAGPAPRALAWIIDTSILMLLVLIIIPSIIFILLMMNVKTVQSIMQGIYLIVLFILWWFYDIYFEVRRGGATQGKKMMGLVVVHDDGTPVSWSSSFIRNLLRSVDFMPFGHFFGFASCMLNKDFKRLGDLSAGTVVVYADAYTAIPRPISVEPVAPPIRLFPGEQRSILDFYERVGTLSSERTAELGHILSGITLKSDDKSAAAVLGYANWILGRR